MKMKVVRRVWDAIWWEEPRNSRDIAADAGLDPDERTCETVRDAVRIMRDVGLPVASNRHGFFKTVNPAELVAFARMMHRKAWAIDERADTVLETIQKNWGAAAWEEEASQFIEDEKED